jgi:hypothetical protein
MREAGVQSLDVLNGWTEWPKSFSIAPFLSTFCMESDRSICKEKVRQNFGLRHVIALPEKTMLI